MMTNKLQRWVTGLANAKAARTIQPAKATRGLHPLMWKALKADMRNGLILPAINVRAV